MQLLTFALSKLNGCLKINGSRNNNESNLFCFFFPNFDVENIGVVFGVLGDILFCAYFGVIAFGVNDNGDFEVDDNWVLLGVSGNFV